MALEFAARSASADPSGKAPRAQEPLCQGSSRCAASSFPSPRASETLTQFSRVLNRLGRGAAAQGREEDSPSDEPVAWPCATAEPGQPPGLPPSPSIDAQFPAQPGEWYWHPAGSGWGTGMSRLRGERC